MPPALMAATPVGARTTMRLKPSALIWWRKVVFPVPALPVRKMFLFVLRTYWKASSSCGLSMKSILKSHSQVRGQAAASSVLRSHSLAAYLASSESMFAGKSFGKVERT